MQFRTVQGASDRERVLDLLDGWPFRDGRRGRDFFRRYLELDPTFEDRNLWVAEEEGELLSCVQIFPRTIRTLHGPMAMGGIGSVFTAPRHRKRGVASDLLKAVLSAMQERGFELSLLHAALIGFYEALGWKSLETQDWRVRLHGQASALPGSVEIDESSSADLSELLPIAERYSRGRLGTVKRSPEDWHASEHLAGNPTERIRVARVGGRVEAYLRTAEFGSKRLVLEWGRLKEPAPLVSLFAEALAETEEIYFQSGCFGDAELRRGLAAAGMRVETFEPKGDRTVWMVQALREGVDPFELLPPERFVFWYADRF